MQLQTPFEVVTPTLDGDILAVLALADTSFTAGQLHRMLAASDEGIRKVLRRLSAQGIVTGEKHGPVSTYRLNREHLAAGAVVALAGLRGAFLDRLELALGDWAIPPTYAAVFGSAGRGEMTIDSDIDLLLIRPDSVGEEQWAGQLLDLAASVSRWTGNDTRTLEFSVSEVRSTPEPVLVDVVAEGITVFGKPAWLRQNLRKA